MKRARKHYFPFYHKAKLFERGALTDDLLIQPILLFTEIIEQINDVNIFSDEIF